jgi:hypothetical protein
LAISLPNFDEAASYHADGCWQQAKRYKTADESPQERGSRVSDPTFLYTSKINLLQWSTANVKARFSPEAKR